MKKTSLQSLMILFIMFTAIFEMKINAQSWNQLIKSVAYQRDSGDNYGSSISISGNYAIVGVRYEDHDGSELNFISGAGCAYLLKKDVFGSWAQIKKINASDRAADDGFGYSVAISGDYAIVGAFFEDEDAAGGNTLSSAGSAYIFKKDQGGADNWGQVRKIVASDRAADDVFGYSVAISGDYAIVGADTEDEDAAGGNTLSSAGSAYIFKKDQGGADNWGQVRKIVASDRTVNDGFGWAVAISGDYAIVGANNEDEDAVGGNTLSSAGSAYIFKKDQGGADNWGQVRKIVASDREANDSFGTSVAISGDYAIVGANTEEEDAAGVNPLSAAGSAYIFKKDQSGIDAWGQVRKIVASDREANDYFGTSVAISGDYAIVGAYLEDLNFPITNDNGSAYIFKKNQGGIDTWGQIQKIIASDREANDYFGSSVAISGKYAQVAAVFEDADLLNNNEGSVYLFLSNTPPTGGNDRITTSEDTVRAFTISDFRYDDVEGDLFVGIKITGLVSKGSLKYNGVDVTLNQQISDITKLEYSPGLNEFGSLYTSFNFRVNDGAEFSSAEYTMTINVTEANHIPVVEINTGCTVVEGGGFTFNDLYLFSTDHREPSYSLVYNITQLPVHGSLTKSGILIKIDGTEASTFTQNDIANAKVKYIHNGGEAAADTFNFVVKDGDGFISNESIFVITVTGVNDSPIFTGVPVIVMNEDEEYTISKNTLLAYVSEPDNSDSLLSVSLTSNTSEIEITESDGNFVLIPNENWFGAGNFTFIVSDGEVTIDTLIYITVEPINDLPVLSGLPSSIEFLQTSSTTINLSGRAIDKETPDSLLVFSFSADPDSINVSYDKKTGIAIVASRENFVGDVSLTVTVTDVDGGSAEEAINVIVTLDPTGIESLTGIPEEYKLYQNYPNPFNPSTAIRYGIPIGDVHNVSLNVLLKVYDILGNEVVTLVNGQQTPGYYEVRWEASNLSSGIYFYMISINGGSVYREVRKMLLIK